MTNLLRALGLKPPKAGLAVGSRAATDGATVDALSEALARWQEERQRVVTLLTSIAARANQSDHKDARAAFIEIQAVVGNLSRDPATIAKVDELERWLRSDQVVSDVDELAGKLRAPLLARLAQIRASLARP